jgi:hypothetical protein
MNLQTSSPGTSRKLDDTAGRRPGRHARPVALPARPVPDMIRHGSLERIGAAEGALADAHGSVRAAGADSDVVTAAFAVARDCLREARDLVREARRELALVTYEMEQERHGRRAAEQRYPQLPAQPQAPVHPQAGAYPPPAAYTPPARPRSVPTVVADTPGLDLCPDPAAAQSAAQFMEVLRRYRVWAGEPSYRVMRDQCGKRYATSTIHAALSGGELPRLPMVQAVVTACGGTEAHLQAFASAWRRLVMPAPGAERAAAVPGPRDALTLLAR